MGLVSPDACNDCGIQVNREFAIYLATLGFWTNHQNVSCAICSAIKQECKRGQVAEKPMYRSRHSHNWSYLRSRWQKMMPRDELSNSLNKIPAYDQILLRIQNCVMPDWHLRQICNGAAIRERSTVLPGDPVLIPVLRFKVAAPTVTTTLPDCGQPTDAVTQCMYYTRPQQPPLGH